MNKCKYINVIYYDKFVTKIPRLLLCWWYLYHYQCI